MLLLLLACNYPDAPPPLPTAANTMDTAIFVGNHEVAAAPVRERRGRKVEGSVRLVGPATKAGPIALEVDGDIVSVTWLVNGAPSAGGTNRSLDPIWFKKGDSVQAQVELSSGSERETLSSSPLKVENSQPEFTVTRAQFTKVDGFVVAARDADGDTLEWRVEDGPPGLAVNPRSGRLIYQGSQQAAGGSYDARIIVTDGEDEVTWPLRLDVQGGQETEVKRRYGGG